MPNSDKNALWTQIQEGVRETEKLMSQQKYNLSMIKARQTLEFMVKSLVEKYNLDSTELIDNIDELYQIRVISNTTREHYHKIRLIGNKAVHEGDNNAYNANTAFHILSQEVYTFANDYSPRKKVRSKSMEDDMRSNNRNQNYGERPSRSSSQYGGNRQRRRRRRRSNPLRIIIPIAAVLVLVALVLLVRAMFSSKDNKASNPTSEVVVTTAPTSVAISDSLETSSVDPALTASTDAFGNTESSLNASTSGSDASQTSSSGAASSSSDIYKTNSRLNIRSAPSTDAELLGTLEEGVTVDFVKKHNSEWSVIKFEGGEVYVNSQYLTKE